MTHAVHPLSGWTAISPFSISDSISSQSQPSTPPVLKVRFLPYMSGSGRTSSYYENGIIRRNFTYPCSPETNGKDISHA